MFHEPFRFPYVWLKDNCQCESCFHPVSKTRKILFQDLDPDIQPISALVSNIKMYRFNFYSQLKEILSEFLTEIL